MKGAAMENFNDLISSIGSRLKRGLGLKPSDEKQLAAWRTKYSQDKADNQDRLESLKDEVRQLEARILQKKAKLEQSRGPLQKIIGAEIEQAFRELDRKEKQVRIIIDSIEAVSIALDKVRELEHAIARHLKGDDLDKVATLTEDIIEENRLAVSALEDLQRLEHGGLETQPMDVEGRLRQLTGPAEKETGLSEATRARLKQLEKQTEG
jgi:hypothetical protein